jgi:hypothetical protein
MFNDLLFNVLLQMCGDTVRVALRIRPLVKSELDKGCQVCLKAVPGEPQVRICNTDEAFTYNYVFPPHVGQEDFYNTAVKRLVDNIFQGILLKKFYTLYFSLDFFFLDMIMHFYYIKDE